MQGGRLAVSPALALDAGQTEIRVALTGERDPRRARAPGVVRLDGAAVGPGEMADALIAAVDALGPLPAVDAIGVGLSGFEAAREEDLRRVDEALKERVGVERVTIASDGVTSLLGALGERLGAVVAAGTGTVCLARGPRRWAKVDGWGSLLGDAGSAFAIGRNGLDLALRELDGRDGSKALLVAAEERFGKAGAIAEAVYRSPVPTRTVASFARDVARVAAEGDTPARAILEDAGRELAVEACAAIGRAFEPGEPAAVSHSGSVFEAGPPLVDAFTDELARRLPAAELVAPQGDALAGAALLAEQGPSLMRDRGLLWSAA
jgi:N-acetylglucosamine kinase-like BadF-type ATPase